MAYPPYYYNDFVQTTDIFNVETINAISGISDELKDYLVRNAKITNMIRLALNRKESGALSDQERLTGRQFPPLNPATSQQWRDEIEKMVIIGPLANAAGTTPYPHGIQFSANAAAKQEVTFTEVRACASNTTGLTYQPIPYASAVASDVIEISADQTNVYITIGKNQSALNVVYVFLRYFKSN